MKQIKLFFLFVIITTSLPAQEGKLALKITYEVSMKFRDTKKSHHPIVQNLKKDLQNLRFTLLLNKNESVFQKVTVMQNDIHNTIVAQAFVGGQGIYYFNKTKGQLIHQKKSGKQYLIQMDPQEYQWKVQEETKTIAGYVCYLATAQKPIKNRSLVIRTDEKPSTPQKATLKVWFAPSLPSMFGPKEFVGLPGTVLKVMANGANFEAIAVEKIHTEIEEPTEGELITEKEFNKKQAEGIKRIRGY